MRRLASRTLNSSAAAAATPHASISKLNFDDSRFAFKSLSTFELCRALAVFRACAFTPLVDHAGSLIALSKRVLGARLTNLAIRHSFFAHFCAGEDAESIRPRITALRAQGVGSILDYAAEADVVVADVATPQETGIECRAYDEDIGDRECDANVEVFLQCIEAASQFEHGFTAIKVTALGKPALLEAVSRVVRVTRHMFYELDTQDTGRLYIEQFRAGLARLGLRLDDHQSLELFQRFDTDGDNTIDLLEWTEYLKVEDLATRPFFTSTPDKRAKGLLPCLSEEEIAQLHNTMLRLDKVAAAASARKVRLMVDAEQSYFQPGIDHVVLNLMRKFNQHEPVVFNTYQAYLKSACRRLTSDLSRSKKENFYFGSKIVRGAYMIAERRQADKQGVPSPVWDTLEDTHASYHACLEVMLEDTKHGSEVMVATHNQESIEYVTRRMDDMLIDARAGGVYFGQLLGMADHLSLVLGQAGYNAFKYVPYGPVDEVVPYLIRRAEENSAILHGIGVEKERRMLWQELRRRLRPY